MRERSISKILFGLMMNGFAIAEIAKPVIAGNAPAPVGPPTEQRIVSPGHCTYYVDPIGGDDARAGTAKDAAWKSLAKVNALCLAAGDQVVIEPGPHSTSLKPSAIGTATEPIRIRFLPGVHEFDAETALRRAYFVSNSSDDPKTPRPVGILVEQAKHIRFEGGGVSGIGKTTLLCSGRMYQIVNDQSEDVTYSGLVLDLKRPAVSEARVLESGTNSAVLQIAEGSDYAIERGLLRWQGDVGRGGLFVRGAIPAQGILGNVYSRGFWNNDGLTADTIEDLGNRRVRFTWTNDAPRLLAGGQLIFRRLAREFVGVHNTRSKEITFRDCEVNALSGMGFVSQFTDTITIERVNVIPNADTIRTFPAWADIFQFSNCRGEIRIESCRLSGMMDDAINCHGTHLRIVAKAGDNQFRVRFMHNQTYGFAAFAPGDEVTVISHSTLRELPNNPRRRVTAVEKINDKEWLLTLDGAAPAFGHKDVIDNITWYPNLTVRNVDVSLATARGFLVTTRGRVLIENCTLQPCLPAILIENDASGWFESGPVRDLTIRNNRFLSKTGVQISPHNQSPSPDAPVHENIRIEGNFFEGGGVKARSVKGLTVINNRAPSGIVPVVTEGCTGVTIENPKGK